MLPIWKDYFVDLGSAPYADYAVSIDGIQRYAGRAYRAPGAAAIEPCINDLIADYIVPVVPAFGGAVTVEDLGTAHVELVANEQTEVDEIFYGNWSYEDGYTPAAGMSVPVDGWIDPRQHLLFSDGGTSWGAVLSPTMEVELAGAGLGSFDDSFSEAFFRGGAGGPISVVLDGTGHSGPRTWCIPLGLYPGGVEVRIEGFTWKAWAGCARYVLHYVNAYGGWDSLLVRGNVKMADAVKHYDKTGVYDNRTRIARGRTNYVNELNRKYTMHSGILAEAESLRMYHLLESTCVYLEDLDEGAVMPVVLTGTSVEYKTYRNNGRKLMEYVIEAELAQDRIRR